MSSGLVSVRGVRVLFVTNRNAGTAIAIFGLATCSSRFLPNVQSVLFYGSDLFPWVLVVPSAYSVELVQRYGRFSVSPILRLLRRCQRGVLLVVRDVYRSFWFYRVVPIFLDRPLVVVVGGVGLFSNVRNEFCREPSSSTLPLGLCEGAYYFFVDFYYFSSRVYL